MTEIKFFDSIKAENSIFCSDPYLSLIEDPDVAYLYKFVDSRLRLKKDNFSLNENDSSVFYKLRHNVFKNYVCFITGLPNIEERPFSHFGVPSNRTPDLIMKKGNDYVVVEYTVTNRATTAIEIKESMSKYDPEIKILKATGDVKDFYMLFSLDQDVTIISEQIRNMCKELSLNINQNPEALLSELRDSFLYLQWHINSTMPELLSNSSDPLMMPISTVLDYKNPFHFETRLVGVKRTRNIFVRKLLMSKTKVLLSMARRKSHSLRYKILLNFKDNVAFLTFDQNGISKNDITSLLQSGDDRIFDHCIMKGTFDDVDEPFAVYGRTTVEINDSRSKSFETYFDDHNYNDRVFTKMMHCEVETLSSCDLETMSKLVDQRYEELLYEKHNRDKVVVKKKNPFIFPVSLGLIYLNKERVFEKVDFRSKLFLTNMILKKSAEVRTVNKIVSRDLDYDQMSAIEIQLSKVGKFLRSEGVDMREISHYKFNPLDSKYPAEIKEEIKIWIDCKKKFKTFVKEDTRLSYGNRVNIPMSLYKTNWQKEIEHFNKDKSQIEISPSDDFDSVLNLYKTLLSEMNLISNEKCPDLVYSDSNPVGDKLRSLCVEMAQELKIEEDKYLRTNLSHNVLFISRLCYSLSYYSTIKLNKNDFCFDNLGYQNVRLIVRGGKKIISSRRSRMFKLVFPITNTISKLCDSTSCEFFIDKGQKYMITPWRQYKQDMLKKGMETFSNFSNYFITSKLESKLNDSSFYNFISLKILNLFSQKRKMEVWFSSLRYIYFNSLGTHSNVLDLIPDMVDYNYDSYFFMIQKLFCKNYENIYKNMKVNKIFDLLHGTVYENFDLCAEKFEETMFMTKAPFDNDNEHLKNMRSVLETHSYFLDTFKTLDQNEIFEKTSIDVSNPDYVDKLFENDFHFDPKVCFLVGRHCADVISTSSNKSSLNDKFKEILGESFTKIQTSKGMRDSEGNNFWGKKGFDVVYKSEDIINKVKDLLKNFPEDDRAFNKACSNSHSSFLDVMKDLKDWKMEFDMKDKSQYKGSREIYVMSDKTKIMQQPLEKFFKVLCSHLPNEIIHKKSHERPKFIHSKIFEFSQIKDKLTYCTLDCRKWAPRSNLWKYVYFILGMKDLLPDDFLIYFLMIWQKMFNKKVRFQKRYCDIIKNNKKTENLYSILEERKDGDFEITMPYSFMMGIFNYLSSLFHAASQLYFDKEIAFKLGSSMRLMAHSDDSGGVIISQSYERNLKTFKFYEIFQKSCNHLMSKKKSVLSHTSFELISIMYNDKKLIPMTHKFLTNVAYDPKGTGWQEDISTVVSKVIDLFSNGGTLRQCYAVMLAQGEMIRKFYHLPRSKRISELPLAFGGIFNMHPIHLIMLGACSQEIMLDLVETTRARDFRINLYTLFTGGYIPGRGGKMSYTLPYFVLQDKRLILSAEDSEVITGLAKYQKNNTLMDTVKYIDSLKLQKFRYSLEGVDTFKILFSSLFYKHKGLRLDTNETLDLQSLSSLCIAQSYLGMYEKKNNLTYSNEYNYMRAAESILFEYQDFSLEMNKTCKPLVYSTFMNLGLNLSFNTVSNILAYNSCDKVKNIMSEKKKWEIMTKWVMDSLPGEDNEKLKQLSVLERRDVEKRRSAYLFMPSGTSIDTVERFWTYTIMYCTKRYQIFKKPAQFYTMEKFEFWSMSMENLKHYFLLIKILVSEPCKEKVLISVLDSIKNCSKCSNKSVMVKSLREMYSLQRLDYFDKMTTNLPFATYDTPQRRGRMVWYGNANFTLYTQFGYVKHTLDDGVNKTFWYVDESEVLENLWRIYKIFCDTRGIYVQDPEYGYTGEQTLRLCFNDLNVPYMSKLKTYSMILENSFVYHTPILPFQLIRYEDGFYYNDKKIDLNIYHVYDINTAFYQNHNLKDLKDKILPKTCSIDKETMINNFQSSKIFKIVSMDKHHYTRLNFYKKYENEGLLGSDGSMTKALCLADSKGLINYKSSINIKPLDIGIFESQSIKDVPILDLMKSISYIRYTYQESLVLLKIANEQELDERDANNLSNMVSKTGLESTAASIVNFKYVSRTLCIGDLRETPKGIILEFLSKIITSIHETMSNFPETQTSWQYPFDRKSWWSALRNLSMLKSSANDFSHLMLSGLIRSQADDPIKFWEIKKENSLFATLNLSKLMLTNTFLLLKGLFFMMLKDLKDEFMSILEKKRYYLLSKKQINKNDIDFDVEFLKSEVNDTEITPLVLEEGSEDIDEIFGGNNPDEYSERYYGDEFDDETIYINNSKDLNLAQEYTITRNFKSLKLISKYRCHHFNWLGGCKRGEALLEGVRHYVTYYPGNSNVKKLQFSKDVFDLKSEEYVDLYKKMKKDRENKERGVSTEDEERKFGEGENTPEYYLEDFLNDTLEQDNIKIKPIMSRILKKRDFNLENILSGIDFDRIYKTEIRKKKHRKNYLPGFSGLLKSPEIHAELEQIFGDNYHFVISGQCSLTTQTNKFLMRYCKDVFNKSNSNHKAVVVVILSILKDCIITEDSDSWFVDSITNVLDEIETQYDEIEDNTVLVAPEAKEDKLKYEESYIYD